MIRDDYAGCGGWSEGLALLGLSDVGYEVMPEAVATRAAAGHETVAVDLSTAPDPIEPLEGYIASPPCQTFSAAGKGEGADVLPEIVAAIHAGRFDLDVDPKTAHVLRVARVCETVDAEWIALEQVPPVLPAWEAIAHRLRGRGYSVWAGVLCAADFGVPQTRRRAILMASRSQVVHPPEPTHDEDPQPSMFGPDLLPWVSMAEALGWGDGRVGFPRRDDLGTSPDGYRERDWTDTDQPAPVVTEKARSWVLTERQSNGATRSIDQPAMTITGSADNGNYRWELDRRNTQRAADGGKEPVAFVSSDRPAPTVWRQPATTVAGDPRITARCHHDEGSQGADAKTTEQVRAGDYEGTEPIRLTITEALILQSFRPDYPVQGSKSAQFLQVGNAVPPLLAAHIVAALTGKAMP